MVRSSAVYLRWSPPINELPRRKQRGIEIHRLRESQQAAGNMTPKRFSRRQKQGPTQWWLTAWAYHLIKSGSELNGVQ